MEAVGPRTPFVLDTLRDVVRSDEAPTTVGLLPVTIGPPRWGDMHVGNYCEIRGIEATEGYIIAEKMNWWIPTKKTWDCGPGRAWSMLERQQPGIGPKEYPIYKYTPAKKQVHWLFGSVADHKA